MDLFICVVLMLATLVCSQMDTGEEARVMEKMFVYGSLQRGQPNHHLLENKSEAVIYKGLAETSNSYPLVIASKYNIPYLLDTPGRGMNVHGELYEVDGNILSQLDALEGHPKYYNRMRIPLVYMENQTDAWAYLLQDYKPFMDTLPYLKSYSSKGSHGLHFVTREERIPGDIHSFTEVKRGAEDIIAPNNTASFDVDNSEKRHLVFVYGTLKRRERNHVQMTDEMNGWAQLIALANTKELFPLVVASRYNIPFLLDKQGVGKIIDGEIYCVNDMMLKKLDDFEDYPIFYTRKVINVTTKNTEQEMMAWTYLLHDFKKELLQKPLIESYSGIVPDSLQLKEPDELTEEDFNAMLAEVKDNRTAL